MVKIPRYKEQDVNLPTGQTDLTSSAVGSRTLSGVADSIRKLVSDVGEKRNANAYRIRRLEIQTNVQLGQSLIYKDTQSFLDSLVDRDDFVDPDQWLLEYQSNIPKLEKKYKKQFDKETWTEFQPYFNSQVWETESKIKTQINTQKIKNAGVAFSQSKEVFMDKVDKADNLPEIEAHWEGYKQLLNKSLATNYFDEKFYTEQFVSAQNFKDMSISWLAVKEGEFVQNPFGENEVDWGGVLRNLNEKVDGEYKYNPDLDPDIRKIMITEADNNFKNQTTTHQTMLNKKNKVVKDNFVDEFIQIRNGTENGLLLANDFAVRVGDSSLMPSEKTAILTQFYAWQNKSVGSTDTWDTPQGEQATALAHTLIYEGLIDTDTERGFLTEVFWQGLISPDNYRTLNNKIDDNIKEKNQYKKVLYKNAVIMLANEVGSREMSALLSNTANLDTEDLVLAMQKEFGKTVYDALNYFNQVLAEGESQGFNYVNMLSNKSSPNYIMDDMVAFAQKARDEKATSEEFDWITDIDPTKPYTLATGVWFEGKQPVIPNFEIPLRNDGETIPKYLKRVQLKYKTIRSDLPSTVSGTQFEQDFDINTLDITPTLE
jgi:hypothetical protein